MKLNKVAAAVSAALLTGVAHAEEPESAPVPDLPKFTPTVVKAPFFEQFTEGWEKRWKPSHAKKDTSGKDDEEEWAYVGEWAAEEPYEYKGIEGDKGLVLKNPAAHHAISAKFDKVDNSKKTLVVQYEVKLQKGLECGGAYMKLLRNKALNQDEFGNTTPYVIMFGPDKCGHTNKVHFIFNHKNPKTGEYEEKHLTSPPTAKIVKTTELYTLIVHSSNNTYAVKVNNEEVKAGSLFEDFAPSVNPEKEIEDANDKKPEDWVDSARIPDPDATKPEDWDEDAPFEVVDEEAEMPEDWLVNEPSTVPDPEAEKPEDWDDEEDGDWIPPTIPNPKCADASGCGPWTKPMKKNPDYKGKWTAPYIDNPAYKGPWSPRKIKNPNYFEDKNPGKLEPIGGIGFELWTMQSDILFDNIYIGHSVEEADRIAKETFLIKHPVEKALAEADKPKQEDPPKSPSDLKFLDDPVLYIREKLDLFLTIAQEDPIQAIKFVPEAAGGIAAVVVTVIALIASLIGLGSSPAVQKAASDAKDKAKEATDKAAAATATGAEKAKAEVTKRSTRSQS